MAIYRVPFIANPFLLSLTMLTGCSPDASNASKPLASPASPRIIDCGVASFFTTISISISSEASWDAGDLVALETMDRDGEVVRTLGWVKDPLDGAAPIAIWLERRIGVADELGQLGSIVQSFAEPDAISFFLDRMSPVEFESALMLGVVRENSNITFPAQEVISHDGGDLEWEDAVDIVRDALNWGDPRYSFFKNDDVDILLRQYRGVDGIYLYFTVLDRRTAVQIEISCETPLAEFDDAAMGWISICLW